MVYTDIMTFPRSAEVNVICQCHFWVIDLTSEVTG